MTRSPLVFALFVGCAPAYRPPTPFVPMLEQTDDIHLALHGGTGGVQLDGAWAPTSHLAVRGGAQLAGLSGDGAYALGTAGAGAYGTFGGRSSWAVTATAGSGYSRGITRITYGSGETAREEVTRNSGTLATAAVRGEVGFESDTAGFGLQLGPTGHVLFHDEASGSSGTGRAASLETAAVARVGPRDPAFRVEFSAGLVFPLVDLDEANVGIPFPLVLGLGLTGDLSAKPEAAPPPAP